MPRHAVVHAAITLAAAGAVAAAALIARRIGRINTQIDYLAARVSADYWSAYNAGYSDAIDEE